MRGYKSKVVSPTDYYLIPYIYTGGVSAISKIDLDLYTKQDLTLPAAEQYNTCIAVDDSRKRLVLGNNSMGHGYVIFVDTSTYTRVGSYVSPDGQATTWVDIDLATGYVYAKFTSLAQQWIKKIDPVTMSAVGSLSYTGAGDGYYPNGTGVAISQNNLIFPITVTVGGFPSGVGKVSLATFTKAGYFTLADANIVAENSCGTRMISGNDVYFVFPRTAGGTITLVRVHDLAFESMVTPAEADVNTVSGAIDIVAKKLYLPHSPPGVNSYIAKWDIAGTMIRETKLEMVDVNDWGLKDSVFDTGRELLYVAEERGAGSDGVLIIDPYTFTKANKALASNPLCVAIALGVT